jgi:Ca-activated chloride channel homolog
VRQNRVMSRAGAVLFAMTATFVLALSTLDAQDGFRFRSGIDLVNVTATVTDGSGRFVPGLTKSDFVVHEDGRAVEVTHFSADRVPVSLGIVLDTSGSMEGEKIANARAAIERFLDQLVDAEDEVFLYGFSAHATLIQDWTTNRSAVSSSLRRVRAAGGTAMYDAMVEAVPMAQGGRNRKKAIVLISDGNDTNSRSDARDVAQIVRETEVLVYAIGIDGRAETTIQTWPPTSPRPPIALPPFPFPGRGRPVPGRGRPRPPAHSEQFPTLGRSRGDALNVAALREITDVSGGRTEIVREARDLDRATSSIADELSKQYYLGYASPSQRDGRWHTIQVEVRDGALRVRARRGYMATS